MGGKFVQGLQVVAVILTVVAQFVVSAVYVLLFNGRYQYWYEQHELP